MPAEKTHPPLDTVTIARRLLYLYYLHQLNSRFPFMQNCLDAEDHLVLRDAIGIVESDPLSSKVIRPGRGFRKWSEAKAIHYLKAFRKEKSVQYDATRKTLANQSASAVSLTTISTPLRPVNLTRSSSVPPSFSRHRSQRVAAKGLANTKPPIQQEAATDKELCAEKITVGARSYNYLGGTAKEMPAKSFSVSPHTSNTIHDSALPKPVPQGMNGVGGSKRWPKIPVSLH
jgi:hypothetical protein